MTVPLLTSSIKAMYIQAARRPGYRPLILAASASRARPAPKPQGLAFSAQTTPSRVQFLGQRIHAHPRGTSPTTAIGAVAGPATSLSTALFQDGWPLWCLLAACGAAAQVCESRTRWGAALSAPLLSMLCAVGLATVGLIPTDCAAYDAVWRYLMPLAAACFLLETDLQRLASNGGPVLAGFTVGAVGMVLGALSGWWLLREALGPLGSKLAACLCASYVGGSVNFAALALALHVPAASLPGAMAADNLLMAVFLGALMAVPVQKATLAVSGGGTGAGSSARDVATAAELPELAAPPPTPPVTAESLSLTLAAAAASCTAAHRLAEALGIVPLTLLLMAVVATAVAAAAQWLRTAMTAGSGGGGSKVAAAAPTEPVFACAAQLGSCLMMLFFAVIGASAGSPSCLAGCGVLVPFLGLMVVVHWVVVLALGRGLLRLPIEALLLGSNACIGGPATAAAMAAAKGWTCMIQPAMLAGSLGYATGTAAGLAVARIIGAA